MPTTSVPTELYTIRSMFTLGGSSAAVWLFTTILALVFDVDTDKYKWIGLFVALAISFIGAMKIKRITVQLATVAFFNGLLIYVTAVGIDSINQGASKNKQIAQAALLSLSTGNAWWPTADLVDSLSYFKVQHVKITDLIKQQQITIKNLKDSILISNKMHSSPVVSPKDDERFIACMKQKSALQATIDKLTQKLNEATKAPLIGQAKATDVSQILFEMKSMNKELLRSVNQYLDAGELNPRAQQEALRNINEEMFALRIQINEYNSRLDTIISGSK